MRGALVAAFALAAPLGVLGQPGPASQPAPPVAAPKVPAGIDLSKPLTLDDAVRVALANSTAPVIAAQGIIRAQAGVTQARAAELPKLNFSWDWTETQALARPITVGGNTFAGAGGRSQQRNIGLNLTQTFYQSGLHEQVKAARASRLAADFGYSDTTRSLVYNVAQNYYTALAAVGLAEVAMRAVASSQQHLDVSDARIAAGTAAKADRYPFEVELAQARLNAISAENQAKTALTSLKQAMGLPQYAQIRPAEALGRPPREGQLEDLIKAAYAARPDIRQAQAQVDAARWSVRVAEIEAGPVYAVTGNANYGRHTGVTGDAWQLSAGVSLPVFDAGSTKAAVASSRASLQTALANLRQAQIDVGAEVERNFLNTAEADARIDAAEATVRSAQTSLDAAQEKYRAGVGTVIDVTDAETKLETAQADRVKALYDYNTSLAALRSAVGQYAVPVPK